MVPRCISLTCMVPRWGSGVMAALLGITWPSAEVIGRSWGNHVNTAVVAFKTITAVILIAINTTTAGIVNVIDITTAVIVTAFAIAINNITTVVVMITDVNTAKLNQGKTKLFLNVFLTS